MHGLAWNRKNGHNPLRSSTVTGDSSVSPFVSICTQVHILSSPQRPHDCDPFCDSNIEFYPPQNVPKSSPIEEQESASLSLVPGLIYWAAAALTVAKSSETAASLVQCSDNQREATNTTSGSRRSWRSQTLHDCINWLTMLLGMNSLFQLLAP